MAITLRSTTLTAALLLGLLAVGTWLLGDMASVRGVLAGGLVMLASLMLGGVIFRPGAHPGVVSLLTTIKLPLVGMACYLLLKSFPVLAVVLGGSVVVTAATLLALISSARRQLLVET